MNLYDRFILPRVVHFTCSRNPNMRQRAKVVPAASGKVLEVGFGSGLNLPFYDSAMVRHLWALDPSQEMWALAQQKARRAPFPVEFLKASAEDVPLADGSVDTVVITYTLCTVADVPRALAQVARVLRADGRLLFCEHGPRARPAHTQVAESAQSIMEAARWRLPPQPRHSSPPLRRRIPSHRNLDHVHSGLEASEFQLLG